MFSAVKRQLFTRRTSKFTHHRLYSSVYPESAFYNLDTLLSRLIITARRLSRVSVGNNCTFDLFVSAQNSLELRNNTALYTVLNEGDESRGCQERWNLIHFGNRIKPPPVTPFIHQAFFSSSFQHIKSVGGASVYKPLSGEVELAGCGNVIIEGREKDRGCTQSGRFERQFGAWKLPRFWAMLISLGAQVRDMSVPVIDT